MTDAPGNEARWFRKRIQEHAQDFPGESAAVTSAAAKLSEFLTFLRLENETTNLVSAKAAEPEELLSRHLADSLLGLPFLPQPSRAPCRLLDIGSGGGFPAIPLLVVRTDIQGTLVESTGKKCAFLTAACDRLALTAAVVNARFPNSFPMKSAGPYDVLTTRAVASAGRLLRLARRLLSPSARALLWTTEDLLPEAVRESGAQASRFVPAPGSKRRGLAVLESFT